MDHIIDTNGDTVIIEAFHPGEFLLEEIEERGMLKKMLLTSWKLNHSI